MSKQIHYNIDNIDKYDAIYNLIYGEKSNGKSYQVKHKKAIEHYLQTGKRFILLRRWLSDITNAWLESYFNKDVDVEKITKGKYNYITSYRKEIYFANIDHETHKLKRGEKIGYLMALSTEQHYSGGSYLDCDVIIFEEFMERGSYIAKESMKLEAFYSTVDRKRGVTKLYMVGNTVSRVCPYLEDWNISNIIRHQKQGTIEVVTIHNEENDVKMAIEYCESSGGKQMTIGHYSSFIDKGAWQSDPQPKLENYKDYKTFYIVGFQYKGFKFLGRIMQNINTKELIWYIEPFTKEFNEKTFVFSDVVKPSIYWQRNIYDVNIRNQRLKDLFQTFRESVIFFSDDLTGTDFKQSIDFSIRK